MPSSSSRPSSDAADSRKKRRHSSRSRPASARTTVTTSNEQSLSSSSSSSGLKQQSIASAFSASEKETRQGDFGENAKRTKLTNGSSEAAACRLANGGAEAGAASSGDAGRLKPASARLSADNMYSFPTRSKLGGRASGGGGSSGSSAAGNVIDLTSSSSSPNGGASASASAAVAARKNGLKTMATGGDSMSPRSGTRKLVVKNLRPNTKKSDPHAYLEQMWSKLEAALGLIYAGSEHQFSIEGLYRGVENVCKQNLAEELFGRLCKSMEQYIDGQVKETLLAKKKAGCGDVDLLHAVIAAWESWNQKLIWIQWLFLYLDRSYLLRKGLQSVRETATLVFREKIYRNPSIGPKAIDGACSLVTAHRGGKIVENRSFKGAISFFHDLGVYNTGFEPAFLGLSQDFVRQWADASESSNTLPEYVTRAKQLLDEEIRRAEMLNFDSSTQRELVLLFDEHVIKRKNEYLTNEDSIADLLDTNDVKSLTTLYSLLKRCGITIGLRSPFMSWINLTGTAIIFDEQAQDQMAIKLVIFKRQLDNICSKAFNRDGELDRALRESFEAFINKTKKSDSTWGTDNSKPAEMIAKYVDGLLRGGSKVIPSAVSLSTHQPASNDAAIEDEEENGDEDSKVDAQLEHVLDLFRMVHGKSVFEAFYKKDLARRLLMSRSASQDAERRMLQRLRTECGAGFTQNLEQMFKDVDLSREELKTYKSITKERGHDFGIDLSINVLSAAAWPSYPDIPIIIPADVKAVSDNFEQYYKSKHSGRRLEWKHALAHCQIRARFPSGNKELVVSSSQAVVLVLFNGKTDSDELNYELIKAATGLPANDLKRTLQSLACAKLRPLTKHPSGREIAETDTFTWNSGFKDPRYRVKINQIQLKETKEENKATHERVAQDRNFEAQAAIVRIMKGRKRITHNELITEVTTVTKSRGLLQPATIKQNIDRLIEKDYIEREDNGEYSYVA